MIGGCAIASRRPASSGGRHSQRDVMDIPWGYIQRHFDWLGHVAEGVCIAAVVALLFMVIAPRRLALASPSPSDTFTAAKNVISRSAQSCRRLT